jgi:Cu(I)/Ag(I) efflux system membrane fusion protein
MNSKILVIFLVLAAFAAGLAVSPEILNTPENGAGEDSGQPAEPKILYWVAPMDPNYRRDEPGKSPMGMDLVPVYEVEGGNDDTVTISPAVENNLGVRTEVAKVRPLWRRIEATGYVGFDETKISHISTRVQGWINSLRVNAEGEQVSKGDLLFELYSPELVNAQKEYLQALRRGSDALLAGADEKLRALGMIPSEMTALKERGTASENIRIIAPRDGIVTALNVREGMYVQPNTTIMSLADLSTVWLQAEVFESQADWVAAGQAAEARLDYLPETVFSGQVDYVYPVLDPKTRTLRVRLRFDNPDERLKPNMYATVSIYGRLKPNALTVSREALIPAPGRDRLVVALGDGRFRVQEVMTGLESGAYVEILAGINEGERVVTSAQFLIDSEASIAGSIARLDADEPVPEQRELGQVFASGRVEEIDRVHRRVRITHGPIDALAWPGMTMVFDTRPGVDLDALATGQDIRFSLVQEHAGEYVLAQIFTADDDTGSRMPEESGEAEKSDGSDGEHYHD